MQMYIKACGWDRYMGDKLIGDINLNDASVEYDSPSMDAYIDKAAVYVRYDIGDLNIVWRKKLQLTGAYRLDLNLSREEIARLFKLAFGNELTVSKLNELGITVADASPTHDQIREAIRQVRLGEFIDIVSSGKEP